MFAFACVALLCSWPVLGLLLPAVFRLARRVRLALVALRLFALPRPSALVVAARFLAWRRFLRRVARVRGSWSSAAFRRVPRPRGLPLGWLPPVPWRSSLGPFSPRPRRLARFLRFWSLVLV